VCYWTNDRRTDTHIALAGPNGSLSLDEARLNFAIYGASQPRYQQLVRPARPEELPSEDISGKPSATANRVV
jgi:Cysteine-rich CPCC